MEGVGRKLHSINFIPFLSRVQSWSTLEQRSTKTNNQQIIVNLGDSKVVIHLKHMSPYFVSFIFVYDKSLWIRSTIED